MIVLELVEAATAVHTPAAGELDAVCVFCAVNVKPVAVGVANDSVAIPSSPHSTAITSPVCHETDAVATPLVPWITLYASSV